MGTGFTIDTPLRVAKYGISSVISLVDDVLIEQMRRHICEREGEPCVPITDDDPDPRANRITAYLDLLGRMVERQIETLRREPFESGSDITRYFEQLPESTLLDDYRAMLRELHPMERARRQDELRSRVVAGSIDVNIMTKLDCLRPVRGKLPDSVHSDAKAALRGFARSIYGSSIVCSAGMSRDLYKYFTSFGDFFPDRNGVLKKGIIIKVSDYRSAELQGLFLAKRGLWVSEFRIESGLNCGGHAFATKGKLLGPILQEFKEKREALYDMLSAEYRRSIESLGLGGSGHPRGFRVTAQGGIGTAEEDRLLLRYYTLDGTGWGTPFLLVPEAVNIDDAHLAKLAAAGDDDVYLSGSSPLGIRFWNLRNSASEEARRRRIAEGRPGSPCRKGYLRFDTSMTDTPLCRASSEYQRRRLAVLDKESLSPERREEEREAIVAKSCICNDLAGAATVPLGIEPEATTAVCCGPNIVNFSRIASLREMIDHIYGRINLMTNPDRPHVFVKELSIYVDYFRDELKNALKNPDQTPMDYLDEFRKNLLDGIDYYINRAEQFLLDKRERFLADLDRLRGELDSLAFAPVV